MTTFYLMRHGEPDWSLADGQNLKGWGKGWGIDLIPLTAEGIRQVESVAGPFRIEVPQLIITSPMTRALQSAAILSHILALPFHVEFDLHEWICPWKDSMELLLETEAEMKRLGGEWPPGEVKEWEPLSKVVRRVSQVLKRYRNFERVVVVCHEMVIYALTGQKMGFAEVCRYQTDQ